MRFRKSDRMIELMGVVLRKMGEGEFLTQIELYRLCPGDPTSRWGYGATRKCLDNLVARGMVIREPQGGPGNPSLIKPTQLGCDWFRPTQV